MDAVKGFIKARSSKLVNGDGNEILLRGVGLGGWLLPEGYMWLLPEEGDRPRKIERMIKELVGEIRAEKFWNSYYRNFVREADIKKISLEGFNSIRLPINSRFLLKKTNKVDKLEYDEKNLAIVDRVINYCKKYKIYVILDLHGAPGGQTGTNIDDSANDLPELFLNDDYQELTIDIWRTLAERYQDEWIIAGYDLLNEPLPQWFSQYNEELLPLYKKIIRTIRSVDREHMIILEGLHWSTDWSIFTEKIDNNLLLQFHKYWNNPDTESIQDYLDKRRECNVPIFMGEGGENNIDWYTGAFRLYEDHNISWNFWTWKKLAASNSPCSINIPENWEQVIRYLKSGDKLDKETATNIFDELLNNIQFENCEYNDDVVRSLFRRPPIRIPAVFYDYKGEGKSFSIERKVTKEKINIEEEKGKLDFRTNDNTDIRFVNNERKYVNFEHNKGEEWAEEDWLYIYLYNGQWLKYSFSVMNGRNYNIELLALNKCYSGELEIIVDDEYMQYETIEKDRLTLIRTNSIFLEKGVHQVKTQVYQAPIAIKWVKINPVN